MPHAILDFNDAVLVRRCMNALRSHVNHIERHLSSAVVGPSLEPKALAELKDVIRRLDASLGSGQMAEPVRVDTALVPWIRAAVELSRVEDLNQIERTRNNILSADLFVQLERRLAPYTLIAKREWYNDATSARLPTVADYLTLRKLTEENVLPKLDPEQFEEKFQVLCSASTVLRDLAVFRGQCAARGAVLALAFFDIDNFKQFNLQHGETRVDTLVLPQFFNVVERTAFGHGRAYRYGGDECVLILPNAPQRVAEALIEQLRENLRTAQYPTEVHNPTISVGFVVTQAQEGRTDRELLDAAADAKQIAKQNGRNTVVMWSLQVIPNQVSAE